MQYIAATEMQNCNINLCLLQNCDGTFYVAVVLLLLSNTFPSQVNECLV